jgi:NADH-quinone oxidoreductase subunit N
MLPLATIGIAASVIGAIYYLKVVKVMYFDEPAEKVAGKIDALHGVFLYGGAVLISPVAYLATGWLGGIARTAAAALFHGS